MPELVLEDLKDQLARKRVFVVVGSGVSVAASGGAETASWVGLLRHGINYCGGIDDKLKGRWVERALEELGAGNLEDMLLSATRVQQTLQRRTEWSRWLADAMKGLEVVRPELLDAIGSLGAPILTTNYDDLLDRHLSRMPLTWMDREEQIAFSRFESMDTVLHLHGHWRKPETVILGLTDYERIVGHSLSQAGLRTMGEGSSLLFIGFGDGLEDPNFEQFLDWTATTLQGARHRHFRLDVEGDAARRQAWHRSKGHRVSVLSYGTAYSDLPRFVAGLVPGQAAADSPKRTPDISPQSAVNAVRPTISAGEYVRLQRAGREAIADLTTLGAQLGWASIAAHGKELSEALEEDLYRVAITGPSRVGKSSLMNQLIGRTVCPVERTITTAIPIVVGPGDVESATISFLPAAKRERILLDGPIKSEMIAPYAAQQHNPNNEKRVSRIDVRLGHQVLDLGVEYVDIPGFDDPDGSIWKSASTVIGQSHALILVLDISPFANGGFVVSRPSVLLINQAHERGCEIFLVCNKADCLSRSDRPEAVAHVKAELQRLGLAEKLAHEPFFLSVRAADKAKDAGIELPPEFRAFEEALWNQLWETESCGLRRLQRVFEAVRVSDEQITALINARRARGPERQAIATALAKAQAAEARIKSIAAKDTNDLRARVRELFAGAGAAQQRAIASYCATVTAESLPSTSSALDALHPAFLEVCQNALDGLNAEVRERRTETNKSIERTLRRLRQEAGISPQASDTQEAAAALAHWAATSLPTSLHGTRRWRVATVGLGTATAFGLGLFGPAGLMVGGIAGLLSAFFANHLLDSPASAVELSAEVTRVTTEAFKSLESSVDNALWNNGSSTVKHVAAQMDPFLGDMRRHLEDLREPTEAEEMIQEKMRNTAARGLSALTKIYAGSKQRSRS